MKLNPNFFVIRISKELQDAKRKKMTISTTGYLGIKYSMTENDKGFLVIDTQEDSPARRAGFKNGDIITAINGAKVENFESMIDHVSKNPPGAAIRISFINSLSIDGSITIREVVLGERPLVLDIPVTSQDMRFNLQFGEIVMIGRKAGQIFPEAEMGDNLIVHHTVEYKERAENDMNWNDWHLIEEDDKFEYRLVHASKEVLGVWKMKEEDTAKAIIPYPDFVFCHPSFKKAEFQMQNGVWVPDAWETALEENTDKLDELKARIEELNALGVMKQQDNDSNYKEKDQIKKTIDSINDERRSITRKMHQKHLVEAKVVFINQKTNEQYLSDLEPGDVILQDYFTLYPLDIYGTHYVLARPNYIDLIIKK